MILNVSERPLLYALPARPEFSLLSKTGLSAAGLLWQRS